MSNFDALHDTVVEHTCPEYDLSPEGCYRAERCSVCGTRRDEHADQEVQSAFPRLDISDHKFRQYEAAPIGTWVP